MGIKSKGNYEWELRLGIGVMLVVLHSTGKLPAAIRPRMNLASLGAENTAVLFISNEKYCLDLSHHVDWDLLDYILSLTI